MIKLSNIRRTLCLCSFAAMILPAGVALAQAIDLDKINKIPRYSKISPQEYEAKSKVFTEIPQGDKFLEYSIRLPEGWQKLGADGEEGAALKKEVPSAKDKFDISNLRDMQLAEGGVSEAEAEEGAEPEDLVEEEEGGEMMSNRMKKRRDFIKPGETEIRLLGPIARYVGPPNLLALSRLEISAMQLSHDITTRNWFLHYILTRNYTLTGMEQISDNQVQAEYVLNEKGVSYVVRTAAISNGSRMILVSYYVPEKFWEKEKEAQEMAINSFKFINPEANLIDDKKTHGFLDLVKFSYPSSWKLIAPNIFSVDNMTAKLLYSTDATTLKGEIDINLISTELDTNLMKEVEFIRADLKKRGLGIGEALDTNTVYQFSDKITFNRVEAYTVSGDKREFIDYEFWLAIMVEDRYYYIVTMLTPGRKADFYTWALNTEAFAYVIQTLMPQAPGETLDASFKKRMEGFDSGGGAAIPKKP